METFWVVRDPQPDSTLDDVLWQTDLPRLFQAGIGAGLTAAGWRNVPAEEHWTIYSSKWQARRDPRVCRYLPAPRVSIPED